MTDAPEPQARDVKGHVAAIGEPLDGAHQVDFDIRHGETVRLHVVDCTMAARLRAAMLGGDCLEILYEESQGPQNGQIIHIC